MGVKLRRRQPWTIIAGQLAVIWLFNDQQDFLVAVLCSLCLRHSSLISPTLTLARDLHLWFPFITARQVLFKVSFSLSTSVRASISSSTGEDLCMMQGQLSQYHLGYLGIFNSCRRTINLTLHRIASWALLFVSDMGSGIWPCTVVPPSSWFAV